MWNESEKDRDSMILNDMITSLELQGYERVNLNVEGLFLYSRTIEQGSHYILIEDFIHGLELTKEQHDHILNQIASQLMIKNQVYEQESLKFLSIILTKDVGKFKDYKNNYGPQWYFNALDAKLIIYEDEPLYYFGFEKTLEDIISKHNNASHESDMVEMNRTQRDGLSLKSTFTLWNTVMLIANMVIFFGCSLLFTDAGYDHITNRLGLNWPAVFYGHEYYRLFTYMFLHAGIDHLVNNMIVLYYVGHNLEKVVGKARYLFIYLGTGIIAGLVSLAYNMIQDRWLVISIGASGAIFGLVGAFAYVLIIHKGRCRGIHTRQMVLFVLLSLYGGFTASNTDNAAHIGGFIGGFILAFLVYRKNKVAKEHIKSNSSDANA